MDNSSTQSILRNSLVQNRTDQPAKPSQPAPSPVQSNQPQIFSTAGQFPDIFRILSRIGPGLPSQPRQAQPGPASPPTQRLIQVDFVYLLLLLRVFYKTEGALNLTCLLMLYCFWFFLIKGLAACFAAELSFKCVVVIRCQSFEHILLWALVLMYILF